MRVDHRSPAKVRLAALRSQAAKGDTIVTSLAHATPDEIRAWVAANVRTIDDIKKLLEMLLIKVL